METIQSSVFCVSLPWTHIRLNLSGMSARILIIKTAHRMINITDMHITVTSKANHQRKKNHCFTSTDSAGGGRSIFTPRGIFVLWSLSLQCCRCCNKRPKVCRLPNAILVFITEPAIFLVDTWCKNSSLRKAIKRIDPTWRMLEGEPSKKRMAAMWPKGNEECLNQHNLQTIIKRRKVKRQRNH